MAEDELTSGYQASMRKRYGLSDGTNWKEERADVAAARKAIEGNLYRQDKGLAVPEKPEAFVERALQQDKVLQGKGPEEEKLPETYGLGKVATAVKKEVKKEVEEHPVAAAVAQTAAEMAMPPQISLPYDAAYMTHALSEYDKASSEGQSLVGPTVGVAAAGIAFLPLGDLVKLPGRLGAAFKNALKKGASEQEARKEVVDLIGPELWDKMQDPAFMQKSGVEDVSVAGARTPDQMKAAELMWDPEQPLASPFFQRWWGKTPQTARKDPELLLMGGNIDGPQWDIDDQRELLKLKSLLPTGHPLSLDKTTGVEIIRNRDIVDLFAKGPPSVVKRVQELTQQKGRWLEAQTKPTVFYHGSQEPGHEVFSHDFGYASDPGFFGEAFYWSNTPYYAREYSDTATTARWLATGRFGTPGLPSVRKLDDMPNTQRPKRMVVQDNSPEVLEALGKHFSRQINRVQHKLDRAIKAKAKAEAKWAKIDLNDPAERFTGGQGEIDALLAEGDQAIRNAKEELDFLQADYRDQVLFVKDPDSFIMKKQEEIAHLDEMDYYDWSDSPQGRNWVTTYSKAHSDDAVNHRADYDKLEAKFPGWKVRHEAHKREVIQDWASRQQYQPGWLPDEWVDANTVKKHVAREIAKGPTAWVDPETGIDLVEAGRNLQKTELQRELMELKAEKWKTTEGGGIYPAYLKIENPFVWHADYRGLGTFHNQYKYKLDEAIEKMLKPWEQHLIPSGHADFGKTYEERLIGREAELKELALEIARDAGKLTPKKNGVPSRSNTGIPEEVLEIMLDEIRASPKPHHITFKDMAEASTEGLKDNGYDSVVRMRHHEGAERPEEWAVFDSEQIKSLGNRGTFDDVKNITHGVAPFVLPGAARQLLRGEKEEE